MSAEHGTVGVKVGPVRLLALGTAIVSFLVLWALYVTHPPDGLVSPIGMAIPVVAGAYLLYLVYAYSLRTP